MALPLHDSAIATGLDEHDTQPFPPRFWWLKRILIGSGGLLLLLIAVRFWWGWEANRRLEAALAEWRANGEPVLAADIDAMLDAVPDDQNAALLYERAMDQMVLITRSGVSVDAFRDDPSLFDSDSQAAAWLMEANGDALRFVRQARGRFEVAWSHRLADQIADPAERSSEQRSLCRLLWFVATYHHRHANDDEAMQTLRDALAFADAIDQHPTLISSLIAWSIHALEFTVIEESGAEFAIAGAGDHDTDARTPASQAQARALIHALLDEERPRQALTSTWLGERAMALEFLQIVKRRTRAFSRGQPFHPLVLMKDWLWDPVSRLDELRTARQFPALIQASSQATWPQAWAMLDRLQRTRSPIRALARPFGDIRSSTLANSERIFFQHLAHRRMAATALAIRLFQVDHGHRPSTLSELIPDYLPAVPVDPLDPDAGPIRYRPQSDDPVLYSVSRDGKDNGGIRAVGPDGSLDWNASDFLFHLDGKPADE